MTPNYIMRQGLQKKTSSSNRAHCCFWSFYTEVFLDIIEGSIVHGHIYFEWKLETCVERTFEGTHISISSASLLYKFIHYMYFEGIVQVSWKTNTFRFFFCTRESCDVSY